MTTMREDDAGEGPIDDVDADDDAEGMLEEQPLFQGEPFARCGKNHLSPKESRLRDARGTMRAARQENQDERDERKLARAR